LTGRVVPLLVELGFEVHLEVGAVSRSIDAVLVNPHGEVLALEFKMRDWRNAVRQARDHQLLCPRAAICMPRRSPSDTLRDELDAHGIGYVGYDPEANEIHFAVEPSVAVAYWDTAGNDLRSRLGLETM